MVDEAVKIPSLRVKEYVIDDERNKLNQDNKIIAEFAISNSNIVKQQMT